MKHSYDPNSSCVCPRCTRERARREKQSRTTFDVANDWSHSRNRRHARVAREFWDAFESGRPMSSDDY
jgi:hypothetical protein